MSFLSEYEKITIKDFKGLYKRGMADNCPIDHAICCENVIFEKKGQYSTRPGISVSYALNHTTKRQFLGATGANLHYLTMDFAGNLYKDNNGTPIFSNANTVDFSALNLFNRVYFYPATNNGSGFLQVWDGVSAVRKAAGFAPATGVTAANGAAGHVDPGVHKFGVCFITDTGFITPPGQKVAGVFTPTSYTAPGALKVNLTAIPVGGPEVIARYIVVTKSNEDLYYFAPGGLINNNVATTLTLDFYDTSLLVSADYLFDLMEEIPAYAPFNAMYTFHTRLFLAPGKNFALVSRPSDPESFDKVDGLITVPNPSFETISAFCQIRDTLYLVKITGILATFDNGDEPATWPITEVDGGHGTFQNAIATISVHSPALAENEMFLVADIGGIFIFNGALQVIPLTWKIDDLWDTLNIFQLPKITIMNDSFQQVFYVLIPTGTSTEANVLLVGDYTDGLTPLEIKWTVFTFPFVVSSIAMANFDDGTGDVQYCLRLATQANNFLFKYHKGLTDDYGAGINSYYQHFLATAAQGSVNQFRAIRARVRGVGDLYQSIWPEDLQSSIVLPNVLLTAFPGKDYLSQINMMNEKMSVVMANGPNAGDAITVERVDIWAKGHFATRPG